MEFILRQQQGKLPYLYLPFHGKGGARAFFTTRLGGVSRGCYSSLNLGYHTGDQTDAVTVNRRLAALDRLLESPVSWRSPWHRHRSRQPFCC
jgi:copper oxidase (laccase) domain-containing protein